jgi:hypothetical protein
MTYTIQKQKMGHIHTYRKLYTQKHKIILKHRSQNNI